MQQRAPSAAARDRVPPGELASPGIEFLLVIMRLVAETYPGPPLESPALLLYILCRPRVPDDDGFHDRPVVIIKKAARGAEDVAVVP